MGAHALKKRRKLTLRASAPVWPLQQDCVAFYGDPYEAGWLQANTVDVVCPWPLFYEGVPMRVNHILIHRKCADSLTRVLNGVWDAVGHNAGTIHALRYDQFDGSYNLRPMRGGGSLSMHAFACAIDWDAAENQFHSTKHWFTADGLMVQHFEAEGWIWGGRWGAGSVDAMHFQAARIHA